MQEEEKRRAEEADVESSNAVAEIRRLQAREQELEAQVAALVERLEIEVRKRSIDAKSNAILEGLKRPEAGTVASYADRIEATLAEVHGLQNTPLPCQDDCRDCSSGCDRPSEFETEFGKEYTGW